MALKIFIVDDDQAIVESLEKFLFRFGYEVDYCTDAQKAVRKTVQFNPDIIISDYKMPFLNGIDFLTTIKQNNYQGKFILITAFANIENSLAAIDAGVDAFLRKPLVLSELIKILQRITEEILSEQQNDAKIHALEKQLQVSQKFESIGVMAGGVAHDFNNILAPILGFTELAIYELPENSPVKNYLKEVVLATKKAKNLIQQILSFSRNGEDDLTIVNLSSVLKESLRLLRSAIPEDIEFDIQNPIQDAYIKANSVKLTQVILNLCTNAYHAMEQDHKGTLSIQLSEQQVNNENNYILTVADTGHGMPQSVLKRIFEPFYTTKEEGKGTGLGLHLVKSILHEMGAEVIVDSTPEEGSTFRLFFPKEKAVQYKEKIKKQDIIKGKGHIVVIDDKVAIIRILNSLLQKLGYHIISFTDIDEAELYILKNEKKIDLIISDEILPKKHGSELAKSLFTSKIDIPFIIISGSIFKLTDEEMKQCNIKAFAQKPIDIHHFSKLVKETIQ